MFLTPTFLSIKYIELDIFTAKISNILLDRFLWVIRIYNPTIWGFIYDQKNHFTYFIVGVDIVYLVYKW